MTIESLKCPLCGGPMMSRTNRRDGSRFWGCKGYPECRGTRDVQGEVRRRAADDADGDGERGLPSDVQRRRDKERWR